MFAVVGIIDSQRGVMGLNKNVYMYGSPRACPDRTMMGFPVPRPEDAIKINRILEHLLPASIGYLS
jgi:hypothetical protein